MLELLAAVTAIAALWTFATFVRPQPALARRPRR
jgi:hypothetical protein